MCYIRGLAGKLSRNKLELMEDLIQEGELAKFRFEQTHEDYPREHLLRTIKTAMVTYLKKEKKFRLIASWWLSDGCIDDFGELDNNFTLLEIKKVFTLFNKIEIKVLTGLLNKFTEREIAEWLELSNMQIHRIKEDIKFKLKEVVDEIH